MNTQFQNIDSITDRRDVLKINARENYVYFFKHNKQMLLIQFFLEKGKIKIHKVDKEHEISNYRNLKEFHYVLLYANEHVNFQTIFSINHNKTDFLEKIIESEIINFQMKEIVYN